MSMKIYKYTSLNSAIAILRSNGVALSNPKDFNDPNDCAFIQDDYEKEKINKLLIDYFVFVSLSQLVSNGKITLKKSDRLIFNKINKEFSLYKAILKKNPYFDRIQGFNMIAKMTASKSKELNDAVQQGLEEFQNKMNTTIEKAKEDALVSCFSKRNNSMLMWSHYASSHRGVCFEYDRPEKDFMDVNYKKDRPVIHLYKSISHLLALNLLEIQEDAEKQIESFKDILDPFFTKSEDWSYEEEVRCLYSKTKLDDKVHFDGKRYILEMDYPTAIYIGCNARGEDLDHLIRLANNRDIPVYFMKRDSKSYDIVIDNEYEYEPSVKKSNKEITLLRLVKEINNCLDSKIYLSAFVTALIIPGICSQVEMQEIKEDKKRYIDWCNTYLPCTQKCPSDDKMAYLTGELIWDLKESLLSNGNISVCGKYDDVDINDIKLRIETRKGMDIYCDVVGEHDVTTNITKFCIDMIYQAERCFDKNSCKIEELDQVLIEDFDAEIEAMEECNILNETIYRKVNNKL